MDSIQVGLTVRDWIALGGATLILGVLVDAFRRLKQDQNEILGNASSDTVLEEDVDYTDLSLLSELPNGGARLVGRDADELEQNSAMLSVNNDDAAPDSGGVIAANDYETTNVLVSGDLTDKTDAIGLSQEKLLLEEEMEVVALNVVSKKGLYFSGDEVLRILLEHSLRFGDMQFFHRHEESAGRGAILFSVADMMKPGVFDIDNMPALRTRGLVFFLTLPGPIHMLSAFEAMLDTATSVAEHLDGDLRDESRSILTQQALDHHRHKINELEHRRLARTQKQG